jgi:hypothetical protein
MKNSYWNAECGIGKVECVPVKFASLHIYDMFNGVKNAEW